MSTRSYFLIIAFPFLAFALWQIAPVLPPAAFCVVYVIIIALSMHLDNRVTTHREPLAPEDQARFHISYGLYDEAATVLRGAGRSESEVKGFMGDAYASVSNAKQ